MTIEPTWGPQGREVYERTYSRLKADGTQEQWHETVQRVVDGNLGLVPPAHIKVGEREALMDLIGNMKVLPAGRHLWTSGVPGRQFNRNCHRAGWTSRLSDHFGFMFDELMKGGGVGANYSQEYLAKANPIQTKIDLRIVCSADHPDLAEVNPDSHEVEPGDLGLSVPDSREGWVKAVTYLIDLATDSHAPEVLSVFIDVSEVRPRGSALRGFGGTASGPGPLVDAIRLTVGLLNKSFGSKLTGMQAMAIDHALAQCVVAGNIRRSARMSIMHWEDDDIFEFITCKSHTDSHWTTNISVEVDDAFFSALESQELLATMVFESVIEAMAHNGEPGFFNSSKAAEGEHDDVRCTNPCGEIALNEWESCNLGHVNLAAFGAPDEEMAEAFILMARFLVRATFAELLNPKQAAVEAVNRRIGVGIMGFQEWLGKQGVPYSEAPQHEEVRHALEAMRLWVTYGADHYAEALGIPAPVKHTTVAPTGTVAKLAGVTEGIHPIYSRYFVRRVRYANGSETLGHLIEQGYETEPCVYNPDTTVVLFHVRDSLLDVVPEALVEQANELTVGEKLAVQHLVQDAYADNAVSFTVNMLADTTVGELEEAMKTWLPHLKGTTVFPENTRPQSPYTAITREEYEAAVDHGVDQAVEDCATGACPIR